MKFDAFASGVEIGGPRSMLYIKVLVCYVLKSVKVPMTRTQLCDAMQQAGLINYFDLNAAIDELLANGIVIEQEYMGAPHIVVSELGGYSAAELEETLFPHVREKAVKTALNLIARAKSERENNVIIEKVENGVNITMQIESQSEILFSLTLNVSDTLQAEQLREGFLNNPSDLYSGIIDKLTENS